MHIIRIYKKSKKSSIESALGTEQFIKLNERENFIMALAFVTTSCCFNDELRLRNLCVSVLRCFGA